MGINLLLLGIYLFFTVLVARMAPPTWRWRGVLIIGLACSYLLIGNRVTLFLILAFTFYACGILLSQKKISIGIAIPLVLFPLLISKFIETKGHFVAYQTLTPGASLEGGFWFFFQVVGISYFTFTGIGYLMDVNRGYVEAETSYPRLLFFLIYFPALTSGPIHRVKHLIPQFEKIGVSDESVSQGLRLILLGLFKNLVVGQRLHHMLTQFYYSDGVTGLFTLLIGLCFFLFLYVNFSSYIDIFQGISETIGIRLKSNFKNRIYLANSRQNFWNGWHITLNEWFRDYFTFPLAHKYRQRVPIEFILLITFILVALWHELTMVMLIWGVLNGLWIILEKKIPYQSWPFPRVRKYAGTIYHLTVASLLALVFISPSIKELVQRLFATPSRFSMAGQITLMGMIVLTVSFLFMDFLQRKAGDQRFDDFMSSKTYYFRWATYFILAGSILVFASSPTFDNYYIQF